MISIMQDAKSEITIAVWQTPFLSSPHQVFQQMAEQAVQAKKAGADVLVCPEMIVTGYAIGLKKLKQFSYQDQIVWTQTVSQIAKQNQIAIAYGFPDYEDTGTIYNACQFMSDEGVVLAQYAKTHLYGSLDRSQFSAGKEIGPCFNWKGWRIGMLICYDIEFAGAARVLAMDGVELILVPTANMPDFTQVPNILVPARAYENSCYVVYANAVGQEILNHTTTSYGGLSTVASPSAELTQAGFNPQLLVKKIEKEQVLQRKSNSHIKDQRLEIYQ
jgi:predicted amidohydrolase